MSTHPRTSDSVNWRNLEPERLLSLVVGNHRQFRRVVPFTVRRVVGSSCSRWALFNRERAMRQVSDCFKAGVMILPTFIHHAPVAPCSGLIDSTGEALGMVFAGDVDPEVIDVLFNNMLPVTYNRDRQRFHQKGELSVVIHSADILFLNTDGSASVGWFQEQAR